MIRESGSWSPRDLHFHNVASNNNRPAARGLRNERDVELSYRENSTVVSRLMLVPNQRLGLCQPSLITGFQTDFTPKHKSLEDSVIVETPDILGKTHNEQVLARGGALRHP